MCVDSQTDGYVGEKMGGIRRDKTGKVVGALSSKQRLAMHNSLNLQTENYESLLMHERMASNSARGLQRDEILTQTNDASNLLGQSFMMQGDMYFDEQLPQRSTMTAQEPGRVSLFESFSGHVNHNNYSSFMKTNQRLSMPVSARRDDELLTTTTATEAGDQDPPLFDRSLSLLEICI